MNAHEKEIEKAKKAILKGISKTKPTPYAKVCGSTSAYAQALEQLANAKITQTYTTTVTLTKEERELEYYRWVPFREVNGMFVLEIIAIKIL